MTRGGEDGSELGFSTASLCLIKDLRIDGNP